MLTYRLSTLSASPAYASPAVDSNPVTSCLSCETSTVPSTQSYKEIPPRLVKQPLSGRVEINANPRHFGNLPSVLGITPATNIKFTDCQEPIVRRLFIDDSFVCWFWNIGRCRLSLTAISLLMILFRGFQIIFCPPLL